MVTLVATASAMPTHAAPMPPLIPKRIAQIATGTISSTPGASAAFGASTRSTATASVSTSASATTIRPSALRVDHERVRSEIQLREDVRRRMAQVSGGRRKAFDSAALRAGHSRVSRSTGSAASAACRGAASEPALRAS